MKTSVFVWAWIWSKICEWTTLTMWTTYGTTLATNLATRIRNGWWFVGSTVLNKRSVPSRLKLWLLTFREHFYVLSPQVLELWPCLTYTSNNITVYKWQKITKSMLCPLQPNRKRSKVPSFQFSDFFSWECIHCVYTCLRSDYNWSNLTINPITIQLHTDNAFCVHLHTV